MYVLGLVAGALTSLSVVPQIFKIWKAKSADEISYKMFTVLSLGVALWAVYGYLEEDYPIVITNSLSLVLNLTVVAMKWFYERK